MKKVIGTEISPRPRPEPAPEPALMSIAEDEAIRPMPHSRHLLDLRQKPVAQEPAPVAPVAPAPQEERSTEVDGPQEVPAGSIIIRDRVAEDVARLGMHHGDRVAPAQVGAPREGRPAGGAGQRRRLFKGAKLTPRRLIVGAIKVALVLIGAVLFLLLTIPLPERLIGVYFVISIVYNIDSQRTFIVALIFLVMVAVSSAIGASVPAESYAVYAFYFLVIGLIAAIREQISNRTKTVGGKSQLSD
jgi:hypothetical protein